MAAMIDIQDLTIRLARPEDADALMRLAQRDSAPVPSAPLLVADGGDGLLAAVSLADGSVIADPFRHSAGATRLLVERTKLLGAEARATGLPAAGRSYQPRATA